ncbi:MAG TPA: DVUA0089 family protein [Edaphobacter sp.]|nr:DVUA0089 family protein [Edaphobacter sp.]
MIASQPRFRSLALLTLCLAAASTAKAASSTYTGSLAADNSVYTQTFDTTSAQDFTFYTTSYGGGTNANGTHTGAGGFVPILTLFSSTTGSVIGFAGGDGTCSGPSMADPSTGICDDAYLTQTLGPGSYTLDLTEFPNVAIGNLNDGFLAGSDTHFTGTNCGSTGTFLQADLAPCVQRTADYALNVTSASAVPEPPTWLLVLPAAAAIAFFGRRQLA